MILCCEGLFLLLGIFLLSFGELRLGGRVVGGRRLVAIGLLLLLQAPFAIWLGGYVLGDVPPGALNGAPAREGLTRFLANVAEFGVVGSALFMASFIWYRTPIMIDDGEGEES